MKSIYEQFKEGTLQAGQRVTFTGTVEEIDNSDDLFPVLVNIEGNGKMWLREETIKCMEPAPEKLVDKPSGKIIGYRCLNTGGKDSWWSVGKVYKVYKKHEREFIIDDERDERFLAAQPLEAAIKYQKDYYGTVFEPVYAEPSTEDPIERIKKDIERLNKDQENLFGKRDRINEQAIKLGSKARKLEEVLEVLEEYK